MKKNLKDSSKINLTTVVMTTVAALATLGIFIFVVIDYRQQRIPMYEMYAELDNAKPIYHEPRYESENEQVYQNYVITEGELRLAKPGTITRMELKDDRRIPIWIKVIFSNTGRKLISLEFIKVWNLIKIGSRDEYIIDRLWGIYGSNNEKVFPPFVILPGHQQIYFLKIAFPVSEKEHEIVQKILSRKHTDTLSLFVALSRKKVPKTPRRSDDKKHEPIILTAEDFQKLNDIGRYIEIHAKIVGEKQIIVRHVLAEFETMQ